VNIVAKALQIDQGPQLSGIADDVGLLEISSFRQEYFKRDEWLKIIDQFEDYPSLVVDVRGNLGGDFVAVMRALSPFLCGQKNVGDLVRPQASGGDIDIEDEVSSDKLYQQLTSHERLRLNTFDSYPCYNGAVTVLIDNDSASVSEIFALAMKSRPQTRVWGEQTRGDMLLGVWYGLSLLGKGYTMSVPEALFRSPKSEEIEGHGVAPSKELYYKLDDARHGVDTWLKAALSAY
jgi:carboxyl-terminal processing protease